MSPDPRSVPSCFSRPVPPEIASLIPSGLVLLAILLQNLSLASPSEASEVGKSRIYDTERIPLKLSSGTLANLTAKPLVAYERVLDFSGVSLLRFEFSLMDLAPGDFVRIRSLGRGHEEVISTDNPHYGERTLMSGLFPGGKTRVTLELGPGSRGSSLCLETVVVARLPEPSPSPHGPLTLCGPDDRLPFGDPCAVRIVDSVMGWGSGFMIAPNWMVTACHVMTDGPWTVERNVQPSDAITGALTPAAPADQFSVTFVDLANSTLSGDPSSAGNGQDWAVVYVPNNAAGSPGSGCNPSFDCSYRNHRRGVTLRVDGFGVDTQPSRRGTLQRGSGPSVSGGDNRDHFRYRVDTEVNNSGSRVTDSSGRVVGIHTSGLCTGTASGFNSGTLVTNLRLLDAIRARVGINPCPSVYNKYLLLAEPPTQRILPPVQQHLRSGPLLGGAIATAPQATTTWFLYPGACMDRANNSWAARTAPVADSLNSYAIGSVDSYTRTDHTVAVGEYWEIQSGFEVPTPDLCMPSKSGASDHFFFGGNSTTKRTVPPSHSSITSCTFPIPTGTASIAAVWGEYLDLPRGSGYVLYGEYRHYRDGIWSDWQPSRGGRGLTVGRVRGWIVDGDLLSEATRSDSIQVRYTMECVQALGIDQQNCLDISPGVLFDDFRLEVVTGVPVPTIGIFQGSLAQTTFVDGTMVGTNCAVIPCWPGPRGSDLASSSDPETAAQAIRDNFNSPFGDSITVSLTSGLRRGGMGINWHYGYAETSTPGPGILYTNQSFDAARGAPKVVFRLFDPSTKSWSPFDSTDLDANALAIVDPFDMASPETLVVDSEYRFDWPPRDKIGQSMPGGFSINGQTAYSQLAFLPRGSRMQYYIKAVDIDGGVSYQFSSNLPALETVDLPTLPGGSALAPDIIEFDVLPGEYPPGPAGSLLAGRTSTPVLNLDGAYTAWSFSQDPVLQALRGLGVRADRYRMLQGLGAGAGIGGHELPGQRAERLGNYFPNRLEYAIEESLTTWYRILIQSSHGRTWTVLDEQDAQVLLNWAVAPTGIANQGDRCVFASGDDYFNAPLSSSGLPNTDQTFLSTLVFGVASAIDAWSGYTSSPYPIIDDRFSAPASGPGLGAPGGYTYPLDGGCPGRNRFDALTKIGSPEASNAAFYPGGTDVAGVATMREFDSVTDRDRTKAIGYAFSIQYIRTPGIPTTATNYAHSGVDRRMQMLHKFLTSCRGPRSGSAVDTALCWPCPTDPNMVGEWSTLAGFQVGTYGPLYPIQAQGLVTAVSEQPGAPVSLPPVNALAQNHPNPFNPRTVIPYSIAQAGRVTIRIYDVRGRLIRTLMDARQAAGPHSMVWDGRSEHGGVVSSGVYFYQITYPDGSGSARKLAILR